MPILSIYAIRWHKLLNPSRSWTIQEICTLSNLFAEEIGEGIDGDFIFIQFFAIGISCTHIRNPLDIVVGHNARTPKWSYSRRPAQLQTNKTTALSPYAANENEIVFPHSKSCLRAEFYVANILWQHRWTNLRINKEKSRPKLNAFK